MADQSNEQWKNMDGRPARNGWAPGFYIGPCGTCGQKFFGAKRSRTCADCAYAEPDPAPPADQSNEMGMVAKVAAAIEKARLNSDAPLSQFYIVQARAAIEAMRTPTEWMNFKGLDVGDYPWNGRKPSRIYTAMIDAALSHDEVKG